jgi:hypothetical protein
LKANPSVVAMLLAKLLDIAGGIEKSDPPLEN